MVASPSRALVMRLTGLSDATVKRWTCWMVHHGVMAQLEVGRLAAFRPMALQAEGGRVSVYVICARPPSASGGAPASAEDAAAPPAVDTTAPGPARPVDKSDPSVFPVFESKKTPYAGARASHTETAAAAVVRLRDGAERSDKRGRPTWARTAVARSHVDRLAVVERLQAEAPALRAASTRALRHELRAVAGSPGAGLDGERAALRTRPCWPSSTTTTSRRKRARATAADKPAAPPPTIRTSALSSLMTAPCPTTTKPCKTVCRSARVRQWQ